VEGRRIERTSDRGQEVVIRVELKQKLSVIEESKRDDGIHAYAYVYPWYAFVQLL
jgi:hypothetical protein